MTMSKAGEKKGGGDRVQIDMHNVSLTASPVRQNKHTTPGTQKLENSKVHKSEIFLWGCVCLCHKLQQPLPGELGQPQPPRVLKTRGHTSQQYLPAHPSRRSGRP